MLKRIGLGVLLLGALALGAGWWITAPARVDASRFTGVSGDPVAGETVYWASGCASCHTEKGADSRLVLAGGVRLESDFGAFVAPNISPHPTEGIGGWTLTDFANAMLLGTSPDGRHYYPAFPYASYVRMTDKNLADLWAFLQTLPASDRVSEPHDLGFPYSIRAAVGGWKLLYANTDWVADAPTPVLERGRYLVEALGHCAECHTPRDQFGGLDLTRWMAGAPNPSGRGRIPGISPAQLDWLEADIAYYLETGFTPDFDTAGGSMASVVRNLSNLTAEDRNAIAAYVAALPPAD